MDKVAEPAPLETGAVEELVFERTPGWREGWVRVSLERHPTRPQVVIETHDLRCALEPTPFVLLGVTRAVLRITSEELEAGVARLGPLGLRALDRLEDDGPLRPPVARA